MELKMAEIIVVGSGIMGATIGEAFRKMENRDVLIIDDRRELAGTPASGGSVTPAKLTGLTDELVKPVLVTLEKLWGLRKENFVLKPTMGLLKYDVFQTDTRLVHNVDQMLGTVIGYKKSGSYFKVQVKVGDDIVTQTCSVLIICTGAFGKELLPEVYPDNTLTSKVGVSFRFDGKIKQAFAEAWTPYKKIFVHPILKENGDWETWGCDGNTIIQPNWNDGYVQAAKTRIMKAMKSDIQPYRTIVGLRPFHSSGEKPCYLKEIEENVWVATGAGKFGCIAAGWAANELLKVY
jgi:hypothetical protein